MPAQNEGPQFGFASEHSAIDAAIGSPRVVQTSRQTTNLCESSSTSMRAYEKLQRHYGSLAPARQAKGLEFDLVIIVQLVGKSAHEHAIGSLADATSEGSQLAMFAASSQEGDLFLQHSQTFYEMIPAIHEFKVLYTAITGAKFGCALLEVNASRSEWSPLLSLWSKEGVVEHLASLDGYNQRVKSGKQCSDLSLDGIDRLASCPVADDSSSVSDSSCDITLPEFVGWLEAELERRQGRDHRRPRAMLRSELAKIDNEDFQLNLAFCLLADCVRLLRVS